MKLRMLLFLMAIVGINFGLISGQNKLTQEEIEKIKAKYGLTGSKKEITPVKEKPSISLAGDLVNTTLKKETAELGKKIQNQSDEIPVEELDKEIDTHKSSQELEDLKDEAKKVEENPEKVVESPGFLKSIFGFPKLWYRISQFNKIASENIKRFNITFNNVGASLASLDEAEILMPRKRKSGAFITDDNKTILWEKVLAKRVSTTKIERLKNECQYIIIKEMVDGFKHLQVAVGPVLDAFYYLAPKLASQSKLIYDVASQFLPMLETLAKENLVQE